MQPRQLFLTGAIVMIAALDGLNARAADPVQVGAWPVDYAAFLSKHDVVYQAPARKGYQGLPLGNGNVGAQVWEPEEGLTLQLNSAWSGVYNVGLCQLRLCCPGATGGQDSTESSRPYLHRLSLHDATLTTRKTLAGGELAGRMFVSADRDLLVYQIEQLPAGHTFELRLNNWHDGAAMAVEDGVMTTQFTEQQLGKRAPFPRSSSARHVNGYAPFYHYAVAVTADGSGVEAGQSADGAVSLKITAAPVTIYAAVAEARGDEDPGVVAQAKSLLAEAQATGPAKLHAAHARWWAEFWPKSVLDLSSDDPERNTMVDYLANCWYMHIYAMGAGHRGPVPMKFNGGLWISEQDIREWGGQYWHWNQQELTWPIFVANHTELFPPYERLYFNMIPAVQRWTKRMYGLDGIQIQETIPFYGDMAPWPTREGIHPRVPVPEKFLHTNLILSTTAEVAMMFDWNYAYTGDEQFLRDKCYPLMREAAKFYVGYLEKDDSGRYVMYPSNAQENFWGVLNPASDIAAIRYLFPRVIELSEQYGVDERLRAQCRERLEHLADYPRDPETGAIWPYEPPPGESVPSKRNSQNVEIYPFAVIPLMTLGTPDHPLAVKTFAQRYHVNTYGWNVDGIGAARLGLADDADSHRLYGDKLGRQHRGLEYLLAEHVQQYQEYPTGLMDYYRRPEDRPPRHPYLEGSGTLTTALSEGLLQSYHDTIRIAPALPESWDARFTLLARGAVLVSAACEDGAVRWATLDCPRDQSITVANPYSGDAVVLCDGQAVQTQASTDAGGHPLLTFSAAGGKTYQLLPADSPQTRIDPETLTGEPNGQPKQFRSRKLGLTP